MASNTAERIVEASLRLFNEHGFQNVPASLIAQTVGISAGNLAYHFSSKRDIVMAVFPLISKEVREVKRPKGPFLPTEAAHRQINILATLWRYRFFFNGLIQLLNSDRALRQQYRQLQEGVLGTVERLFDELVAENYFLPTVAPVTTRMVAMDIWMIWLSWLRFEQIENPSRKRPRGEALHAGLMMNFTILQQYLPADFSTEMLVEFQKVLPARKQGKKAV